ncbi:MAG: peptidase M16 [Desulfobacteraceae bacterium 4484_190.3]|nr:MAG: peptidase M16 [Desulfobacteraceae bacterium 4484_190.3]
MTIIHGFRLIKEQEIAELNILARLFTHEKTCAELLSLSNDDENKVFGITFKTPPSDSTGAAHILEHSVLCGSRKYPVKEPFVELLKGSLQTFLNAFTYPDKTCYPVASQNVKDFYNLIDVYLDAVFYPRLTPHIFEQEGWHYELQNPNDPLSYKGVVFNEMKGAYSSPEQVLSKYTLESLFPDNPYGLDSGGDPREIPKLTFEQFKAFHAKYYHPSNARIYFYGDDDPEQRLKIADGYLSAFERAEILSSIPLQPAFHSPRRLRRRYMAPEEGPETEKGMLTVNWAMGETSEVDTNFSLRIMEYILLGMPASPLRKALLDSGFGEDLAGEGLGDELRQLYFSTGLKGIGLKNADKTEQLVLETLDELSTKGIDPNTVEAALNTIEFRLRENNTGQFPRGLLLMLRALTSWLYGKDPLALLAFEKPLENIKKRWRETPRFFESRIQHLLLQNTHRTTLILEPDPNLREKVFAEEEKKLQEIRSKMGPDQLEEIVKETRELQRIQQTPDPPEALATIPRLKLEDLEKTNKMIPLEQMEYRGVPLLFHDLFTNGIVYLDVGMNLHAICDQHLPLVPLFGRALLEMGTEKEDFVRLTQRISRNTGGIVARPFTSSHKSGALSVAQLFLQGKAMVPRAGELLNILRDVLLTVRFDNRERFRQMVLEEKAGLEHALIPQGHQIVNLRLRSHYSEAHWAAEQMGGITYLFFLRDLVRQVDEDWAGVLSALEAMRDALVNTRNMIMNVTVDGKNRAVVEQEINTFLHEFPERETKPEHWAVTSPPRFEGLTIPAQVNYVGKGTDLFTLGYHFHGSALVIARYLRTGWLWEQVRVLGGAYGAFCMFDRFSGILTFVSYRDPNILKTLDTFDHTAEFLKGLELPDEERVKSIIGAIGDLDAYLLPDAKGYASMIRYLCGDSEEERQQMREEVLGTSAGNFRAFADFLSEMDREGAVKVLGSPDAVTAANEAQSHGLHITRIL